MSGPTAPETTFGSEAGGDPGGRRAPGIVPPSRADRRRQQTRQSWAVWIVPPIGAFAFALLVLFVAALIGGTAGSFLSPHHWARWDSGIYLTIAAHGPDLMRCSGPAYPPHSWCGTAGWAPLYPLLIAILGQVGFTLAGAGMVLAALFALLSFGALWVLIGPSWTFEKLCCLAFAACFPGMIYYFALYPVSLCILLTVVCLMLFIRGHYWQAGVVGAVCTWAFATGPVLIGVLFLAALLVERGPRLWRVILQSAGVVLAGFVALLVAYQGLVGNWQGYLLTQTKYANGLHDPVATFVTAFTGGAPGPDPLLTPNSAYNHVIPQAQTAFVAVLVIGLVAWACTHRPLQRADLVILCYTVVVWIAPFVDGATLARYRIELLLVPCVYLCTRLPRVVQVALVATSVVLAVGLALLFSESVLF